MSFTSKAASSLVAERGPACIRWQQGASDTNDGHLSSVVLAITNTSGCSTTRSKMRITRGRNWLASAIRSRKLAKLTLAAAVGAAIIGPATAASAREVAQVGTSSVIAVQGPHHSLLFYWQTIGGVPWHPEVVSGPGTAYSAPSVAQVGSSSVIAVEGPHHSLLFFWQTIGTVPWHPELVAGFGSTFSAPTVTQVGSSSVITAQGLFHSQKFYWQAIGGVPWHPELVAPPGTAFA